MTPDMYREITARLQEIDQDDDIWCGIVTGTGRAFTAGADLKVMHQPSTDTRGGMAWSRGGNGASTTTSPCRSR